jgi:hypothetical protein
MLHCEGNAPIAAHSLVVFANAPSVNYLPASRRCFTLRKLHSLTQVFASLTMARNPGACFMEISPVVTTRPKNQRELLRIPERRTPKTSAQLPILNATVIIFSSE